MKNYIHKIARDNIKKEHKFYKYIFIAIVFSFFVTTLTSILVSSFYEASFEEKADSYGKWSVALFDPDKSIEEMIRANKNVKTIGKLYYSGEVIYDGKTIGNIGSFDKEGLVLANIHIKNGRMIESDNEVVIEQSIAEGLKVKIGDKLTLDYLYQNQKLSQQFKIVGIIEDYSTNWSHRALSFITNQSSKEYDLLLDSQYTVNLWNSLLNIKDDNIIFNIMDFQNIEFSDAAQRYVDNSHFLTYMFEIVFVSLIIIMSTMMSSLNKREGQFVLLRCIGATSKQIQKIVIWEGLILSTSAFVLGVLSGFIMSYLIMVIYSFLMNRAFVFVVQLIPLLIQLLICIITLLISIFLPSLTVYDMPLVNQKVYSLPHPKKKKITKPTFLSLVYQELTRSYIMTVFICILICMVFIKANITIISLVDYHQRYENIQNLTYEGDFIIDSEIKKKDIEALENNPDIQLYYYFEQTADFKRGHKTHQGNIRCVDSQTLNQYKIKGEMIKNSDEALMIVKKSIDLKDDRYIKVAYKGREKEFHITGYIVDDMISEDIIIVSQDAYSQLIKNDILSHIVVDVNDEINRCKVQSFFNELSLKYSNLSVQNKIIEIQNQINDLNTKTIKDMIYTFLLLICLIFMIYIMRLLSTNNLRHYIGMLNAIGMTKKKIFLLYFTHASLLFVISILIVGIGYLTLYGGIGSAGHTLTVFVNEYSHFVINIIVTFILYLIYMLCMLFPIKNICHERILNLIQKAGHL